MSRTGSRRRTDVTTMTTMATATIRRRSRSWSDTNRMKYSLYHDADNDPLTGLTALMRVNVAGSNQRSSRDRNGHGGCGGGGGQGRGVGAVRVFVGQRVVVNAAI
ncbi:hypothetical protein Droror1_Dr00012071 [Drosera rotundifolia]